MTKIQYFNAIHVETPLGAIYKRLGWHNAITRITPQANEKFNSFIKEALNYIKLSGVGARIPIVEKNKTKVILSTGDIFESKLLTSLLRESSEILILAATAGKDIIEAIHKSEKENLTKSVVFDAVASEITDASMKWLMLYFNQELCRENKHLTPKRISCGYGDFSLSCQLKIFSLLKLKKLDMEITGSFMLVPEKSVTALTGIIKN